MCVCPPPFRSSPSHILLLPGPFPSPLPPRSRPPLLGGEGLGGHQWPHGHAAPERKARARGSLRGLVSHAHCSAKEWGMLEERGILCWLVPLSGWDVRGAFLWGENCKNKGKNRRGREPVLRTDGQMDGQREAPADASAGASVSHEVPVPRAGGEWGLVCCVHGVGSVPQLLGAERSWAAPGPSALASHSS